MITGTLAGTKGNEGTILSRSWDVFSMGFPATGSEERFSGGRNRAIEEAWSDLPREGGQLFSLDACSGNSTGDKQELSSPKKWRVTRDESGPHRGGAALQSLAG